MSPMQEVEFCNGLNLIYSQVNAQGKTSLIRIILYALGYPIPGTKGLDFKEMRFCIHVNSCGKRVVIERKPSGSYSNDCEVSVDGDCVLRCNFVENRTQIQKTIFPFADENLLCNLLGVFYIDQEKGWTLLNRGKVIGGISFNIEQFLCSLGDTDIAALKAENSQLNTHLSEYRKLLNFASLASDFKIAAGDEATETSRELEYKGVRLLSIELDRKQRELEGLLAIRKENKNFLRFIEKFSLRVKSSSGEIIPVKSNTLLDFNDNYEYIQARIEILRKQITNLRVEVERAIALIDKVDEPLSSLDLLIHYKKRIRDVDLNSISIQEAINTFKRRKKQLRDEIKKISNNAWLYKLNEYIRYYLSKLSVKCAYGEGEDIATTNKLAMYSGAEMTKRVLAFRFSYLKAIEEKFNVRLPMIIDSPYAKEFDEPNFSLMMSVLHSEFSNYQIFFASIYDKNLSPHYRKITLTGGAWDAKIMSEIS